MQFKPGRKRPAAGGPARRGSGAPTAGLGRADGSTSSIAGRRAFCFIVMSRAFDPSSSRRPRSHGRGGIDRHGLERRARDLPPLDESRRRSRRSRQGGGHDPRRDGRDRPRRRWWRLPLWLAAAVTAVTVAGLAVVGGYYHHISGDYDLERVGAMPERSVVLDREGRELGRLHGQNRIVVGLDEVAPEFIAALLIREDAAFRRHGGVDPRGVLRAMVRNLRDRDMVQGASTITMQLARNSFGMQDKTLHRKCIEMALARRIEQRYSKDEILGHYVNRIFFGSGIYGIERASRAYFGKPAADLTLSESALLAGIIRSPNRFSPFHNPSGALSERDTVLDRMIIQGVIDAAAAEEAKAEPLSLRPPETASGQESWALDAVRRDLDLVLDDRHFEDGGLRIHTTFDAELQRQAEEVLNARLAEFESRQGYGHVTKLAFDHSWVPDKENPHPPSTPYLQGSMVMLDNTTGGVLALVGGRDFSQSVFNRALLANRQVGSTFKPFVYAAAFERGLLPGTLVSDDPIAPGEVAGLGNWSPRNADGTFTGWQPAETGLIRSRNTMSVRVGTLAGLDRVAELSRQLGLQPPDDPDLQLFIGNTGATLYELTSAFSVFATEGMRRRPYVIERIEDSFGNVVYRSPLLEYRALDAGPARLTRDVLERVMDSGTGARARDLGFTDPAGGKTGTTNNFHDAWFVGFTDRVSCGVWVGFDQPKTIGAGAYGGQLALPVWADAMIEAGQRGWSGPGPRSVAATQQVQVCRQTGRLATDACRARGDAYELELPFELIPRDFCRLPVESGGRDPVWQDDRDGGQPDGWFRRMRRWLSD